MKIIDKDSYFLFSGGEVQMKEDSVIDNKILCRDYTMNGFMALAQYVSVVRRHNTDAIEVIYPYFPYARQDRSMGEHSPFSLKIFCELLKSLKLERVIFFDPHSYVTSALTGPGGFVEQWDLAKTVLPKELFSDPEVMFVSPDAGAFKKVSKLMPDDRRICIGTKIRDVSTGKILATNVYSSLSLRGRTCVIVDDICDGGRTFIELAKTLKGIGAEKVILYVTHAIFSNGTAPLLEYIDHVYTTDSFVHKELPENITVKELNYETY